jgi:hypothetical protein
VYVCVHVHIYIYMYVYIYEIQESECRLTNRRQSHVRMHIYICMYTHTHIYKNVPTKIRRMYICICAVNKLTLLFKRLLGCEISQITTYLAAQTSKYPYFLTVQTTMCPPLLAPLLIRMYLSRSKDTCHVCMYIYICVYVCVCVYTRI